MADVLANTVRAAEGAQTLPVMKQFLFLIGISLSVAVGFYVVLWSQDPHYVPVSGSLSHQDAGDVITALDRSGIKYKLDPSTGMILVDSTQAQRAKIELAKEGVPSGMSKGLEILDKESSFGTSQFIERTRYIRGLQGELERTITKIDIIKSARVHLAIPKQSSFIRVKRNPSASVFIDLQGGYKLSSGQVAAIVNLVASSVQGMSSDNVTVIDQNGNLLSSKGNDSISMAAKNLEYTKQIEELYATRIFDLVSPIVGEGGVRAEVTALVDFTMNERTYENFNPAKRVVRSEQTMSIKKEAASFAGGIPGALSNIPPNTGTVPQNNADEELEEGVNAVIEQPNNVKQQATRNYEIDRTIGRESQSPGKLMKLSVAVVLDDKVSYNRNGEMRKTPLTEDEITKIEKIIKDAIGFDDTRGDKLSIINSSFAGAQPISELAPIPFYQQSWFPSVIKQSLAGLFIIILIFAVLKPMFKNLVNVSAMQKKMQESLKKAEAEQKQLAERQFNPKEGSKDIQKVKELVHDDPMRVAQVVKGWVDNDNE